MGLEPILSAWKADRLPINGYSLRINFLYNLPKVGLEPTLLKELESKPNVSTYFTTLVVNFY